MSGAGAACSFGLGAALQHQQVQLASMAGRIPFQLLAQLARRWLWVAGIALGAVAYGLQALALAFGPLALVAPIVATRDWVLAFAAMAPVAGGAGRPECSLEVWPGLPCWLSPPVPSSSACHS